METPEAANTNGQSSKAMTLSGQQQNVSRLAIQLAKLMAWCQAMCLKQPLTDIQADVHLEEWLLIAQDVGYPALEEAVKEVLRSDSDWFPSVAAIRKRAGVGG